MSDPGSVDLDRHVYGNVAAPVTIVEYGDFECPYCRAAAPVLREVVDSAAGSVRLVWRHFPLFQTHAFALTAALAAEASGERFWQMHDLLFAHQDRLTDPDLAEYGRQIGAGAVTGDAAQAHRPAVEADYRSGIDAGVRGTPTLLIDGRLYTGKVDRRSLTAALDLED
ncbi:MAG TPA: DsbA family protein [Rugosimonospora sp.]